MFEAFKVGVTIALTNQVSKGLGLIGRDLAATERNLKSIQREFNVLGYSSLATQKRIMAAGQAVQSFNANVKQMKVLAGTGIVLGAAGYGGLKALGATAKAAEEYTHQVQLANSAMSNLDPAKAQLELAQMTAAAWKTTGDVLTTTPAANMKALRELKMVLGSTEHAVDFLPQMQKIQAVLDSALHGEGGIAAKDVAFTAAKALELRGATNTPQTMAEQADLIVKAVIASGGRFTPQMLLQAQKYAGIGGTGYSNDFLYGILPTLTQELGGSQTGNSLTSMYRAIVGGRIDKKSLPVWQSLGLIDTVKGVTGETAMVQAKNAALFQKDPAAYMQFLQTRLAAAGLTTLDQQQQAVERMFSNRVAARMANILVTQSPRLQKDFRLIGQAGTSGEYDRLVKTDPVMARAAAAAQWEGLKTVIGLRVIPILIPAIHTLADGLQSLTRWAERNPKLFSTLIYGFAGLSAALAFSGTVMLLRAGFMGLSLALGLGKGGLIGGVETLLPLLTGPVGLVAALGLVAAATIAWHKQIADWIDGTGVGRTLGDNLLAARDWLNGGDDLSAGNRFRVPPPAKSAPIHTTVSIDGRKVAEAVGRHQTAAMNAPPASSNLFDTRLTPAGTTGTW